MSKMFDYVSGKAEGEVARLEAQLEHVMRHCVPSSAMDELVEALEQIEKMGGYQAGIASAALVKFRHHLNAE